MNMDIFQLLHLAKAQGASDLHLVVATPPLLRINGQLNPVPDSQPVSTEDIERAFNQLTSERERAYFQSHLELDFGYTMPDVGRLRCNVARQRGSISMVTRLVPLVIPNLHELSLPDVCRELVMLPRGLIVVSGPTGSGKSTTLAAMVSHLNNLESRRVVTIEDPIEYIYSNIKCTITQRELGSDTLSFAEALRHVLRQDPDVILVGEMRDLETAAAALTIAETGHLVLTTGHAPSASQAIERIVDLFPPHERYLSQSRLASLLIAVLCQTLIPKIDGSGRIPAVEIMLANPAIRNLIREGKIFQLPNAIRTHARLGMQLFDQDLVNLYTKQLISSESVLAYCADRDEVSRCITETDRGNLSLMSTR